MGIFSKEKTYNLEPMLTEEQKQAMKLLTQYGQTGRVGDFQAGDQYTGSFGNFTATPTEGLAVNRIYDLLQSGTPSSLAKAEDTLTRLADTAFDPTDPSSGYGAYSRQVARATKDADDVLNREAAITGSRFGSRILGEKGDLAARQGDMLSSKLSDLYNRAQDRSLSAARGLTDLGGTQENILQSRIGLGSQMGGLQRMLDTARAQAQYGEWQRARNERLGSVGALSDVFNRSVDYGSKSLTTSQETPWGKLLNAGLTGIGTAIGGPIGGAIGDKVGSLIKGFGQKKAPFPEESWLV